MRAMREARTTDRGAECTPRVRLRHAEARVLARGALVRSVRPPPGVGMIGATHVLGACRPTATGARLPRDRFDTARDVGRGARRVARSVRLRAGRTEPAASFAWWCPRPFHDGPLDDGEVCPWCDKERADPAPDDGADDDSDDRTAPCSFSRGIPRLPGMRARALIPARARARGVHRDRDIPRSWSAVVGVASPATRLRPCLPAPVVRRAGGSFGIRMSATNELVTGELLPLALRDGVLPHPSVELRRRHTHPRKAVGAKSVQPLPMCEFERASGLIVIAEMPKPIPLADRGNLVENGFRPLAAPTFRFRHTESVCPPRSGGRLSRTNRGPLWR